MAHTCTACIVTCEDFRLHRRRDGQSAVDQIAVAVVGGDYDLITRAGGVQDLVRGPEEYAQSLLRDIGISVEKHSAGTVCLMNHADCGAYGHTRFSGPEDEFARHHADLLNAAAVVRKRFPSVRVILAFASLGSRGGDHYEARLVEDSASQTR